jgi:serine/threonine protein kinase
MIIEYSSTYSPSIDIILAHIKETRSVVEIKKIVVDAQSTRVLRQLVEEFVAMRYLHHPNIINYIDAFRHEDCVWAVMAFSPSVLSLRKVIAANTQRSSKEKEGFIKSVSKGVLKALTYLHRKGIVHRDVIAENVFIGKSPIIQLSRLPID